jgi:hypothetical protein
MVGELGLPAALLERAEMRMGSLAGLLSLVESIAASPGPRE